MYVLYVCLSVQYGFRLACSANNIYYINPIHISCCFGLEFLYSDVVNIIPRMRKRDQRYYDCLYMTYIYTTYMHAYTIMQKYKSYYNMIY